MPQSRVRDLLERLERNWSEQGAPISRCLLPGVSDRDLDAAEQELGFPLPLEVREWYGWHNGLDPDADEDGLFPTLSAQGTLSDAIQNRQEILDEQVEESPSENLTFQPTWLALTQPGKSMIVADCAGAAEDPNAAAPLHTVNFFDVSPWTTPKMPSITAMLEGWLQLTESGVWYFDRTNDEWEYSLLDVPEEWRNTRLFG